MKKFISILGIAFLAIIIILNLLFTANLDASEHITITNNTLLYIIGLIAVGILILWGTKTINEYLKPREKMRKIVFITALIIYILFSIVWVIVIRPPIIGDSGHVCDLAQTFYNGDIEEYLPKQSYAGITMSEYMQAYHQQITISFVFSMFYRIIHCSIRELIRGVNIISNILIIISLYKISNQLSNKYEINKVLLFTLILTFLSIPMLSTFVYGDIPSLALCMFSVYFMMKYTETKELKYPIFASILTMIAYMLRMNSLIFIIATLIYLILNLFKEIFQKTWNKKESLLNILIIIMYLGISIIPSIIVQNYYLSKYNLDKNKAYPSISYFLMAMEEGPRANGWYNESIAEPALKNPQDIQPEYVTRIKERLKYFSEDIEYTFKFYITKIASMWTENTYSAVRNNTIEAKYPLESAITPLTFYQKILLILTCLCSLIALIQNRKNISIDIIFLITIFIGGFLFHILWEAKSRYIIPYIVVLIPVAASINLDNIKSLVKLKQVQSEKDREDETM